MLGRMFSDPQLLWLALIPFAVILLRWLDLLHNRRAIPFSSFAWLPSNGQAPELPLRALLFVRWAALCAIVPIMAGIGSIREAAQPQVPSALVIVLDISSSMTADDFAPTNRLEEAKRHLKAFAASNSGTETGLILFAAVPRLVVPVTLDREAISASIEKTVPAGHDEDGTAIGSAVASAVNRLRDGPWLQRRILLITDGANNRGALAPVDAADIAAAFAVRIDTIGIGTDAVSRFWAPAADGTQVPVQARIDIDEQTLEALASKTGGAYQRVRDSAGLAEALKRIQNADRVFIRRDADGSTLRLARILAFIALILSVTEFFFSHFIYAMLPE